MKPLLIASLLALATPQAQAGGLDLDFGFGFHNRHGVRIGIGLGIHKERHRHPRVHRHDRHCRHWVAGRYETILRREWVPGHYTVVYEPVRYGYRYDRCGTRVRFIARHARSRRVWVAGHEVERRDRVWRPGHWRFTCRYGY